MNGPVGFTLQDGRAGWGRAVRGSQHVATPRFLDEASGLLEAARAAGLSTLGVGLGRSYGDSGLNLGQASVETTSLDRLIAFDPQAGLVRVEAGMSLGELQRRIVPHGWFTTTTPGSRFVTLGGAVANDVHGKNHHRAGTLGASVTRLGLLRSDRGLIEVSEETEPELFRATVAGLGLTGLILWVELRLSRIGSAWLRQRAAPFTDLDGFFALAREAHGMSEHVVAWVDCTDRRGRGVLFRSDWRHDGRLEPHADVRRASLPVDLPGFALNRLTLRLFNALYRNAQTAHRRKVVHYAQAFYPLDAIGGWNRLYGARGFFQYQCVIPPTAARDAVAALLAEIARSGEGSFLAVLKLFGDRPSPGLLSFPFEGVTLALDFANRGPATSQLFARLDAIVGEAKGRLYPAKDGRMPAALFLEGYPELERFSRSVDPAFSSTFWRRVRHG